MKIRIKGNSLRYRLTKTDLTNLAANGYIEETSNFSPRVFKYALCSTAGNTLSASFENDTITINMPQNMVDEWAHTDRVGFEQNNSGMYLLVEKDFVCLDTVAEDQSDNYPNPLLG